MERKTRQERERGRVNFRERDDLGQERERGERRVEETDERFIILRFI